jgi:hypothetical protein
MVTKASQAAAVIERTKPLLAERTVELGHADADRLVAPSHPGSTPGELVLCAAIRGLAVEVEGAVDADVARFRSDHEAVHSALAHGDPDLFTGVAADTPGRASPRLEPEWALMGALAFAELFTIHGPLETSIGAGAAAWLLAGMLAAFAAVLAHCAGALLARASVATVGSVRDRALAGAYVFAGGVVLIGVVAALARIVNALVLNQIFVATRGRAGERLDGWGVAFFVGFQAIFVLVNLALASREATRRLEHRMTPLRERARDLDLLVGDLAGWTKSVRREFWALAAAAVATYRTTLATDPALSPRWAHLWAERNSAELSDGTLMRRLFPGVDDDLLAPSAQRGAPAPSPADGAGREAPAGDVVPPPQAPSPPPPPASPPRQQPFPPTPDAEGAAAASPAPLVPGVRPARPAPASPPTQSDQSPPPGASGEADERPGEDLIGDLAAL